MAMPDQPEDNEKPQTAEEALKAANVSYRSAVHKRRQAESIGEALRRMRTDNHFAERIRLAFEGDR